MRCLPGCRNGSANDLRNEEKQAEKKDKPVDEAAQAKRRQAGNKKKSKRWHRGIITMDKRYHSQWYHQHT